VSKTRILEVVSGFGIGGAEKALSARMPHLPDEFEQTILNIRPEIDAFQPKIEFKQHKVWSKNFRRMHEIRKFLISNSFEVVIVRTPLDAIRLGFLKAFSKKQNYKLVFEAHSNFLTKKYPYWLILRSLLWHSSRNIDLVIAVSDDVMRGPLCSGQRKIQKIHLGSHLDFFDLKESSMNMPHLLFIGRLIHLKRPIWLLERILNLSKQITLPKPTLTMVGSGPLENVVREFIRKNNLGETIHFVGAQDNVSKYFSAATHLVSCSTNEGLPLTFFEAKLAGLSILATPSGGGNEIFEDEDLELKTFSEVEFELALLRILSTTPPSLETRRIIQSRSKWMSSEESAKRYYFEISRLLSS
jgi:glycosyltransferase involved in cell wall biosynthesis